MNRRFVRVVKLGGSLLELSEWEDSFRTWRGSSTSRHDVVVVGGGRLVDGIRRADRDQKLGETIAHWRSIAAMSSTARRVAKRIPEAQLTNEVTCLDRRVLRPGLTVFDVQRFLKNIEPHRDGTRLPCSWDVTSDSIAARLAIAIAADELVLLKSAEPCHGSYAELAESGYVDRFFPQLGEEMPPVSFVNLANA